MWWHGRGARAARAGPRRQPPAAAPTHLQGTLHQRSSHGDGAEQVKDSRVATVEPRRVDEAIAVRVHGVERRAGLRIQQRLLLLAVLADELRQGLHATVAVGGLHEQRARELALARGGRALRALWNSTHSTRKGRAGKGGEREGREGGNGSSASGAGGRARVLAVAVESRRGDQHQFLCSLAGWLGQQGESSTDLHQQAYERVASLALPVGVAHRVLSRRTQNGRRWAGGQVGRCAGGQVGRWAGISMYCYTGHRVYGHRFSHILGE